MVIRCTAMILVILIFQMAVVGLIALPYSLCRIHNAHIGHLFVRHVHIYLARINRHRSTATHGDHSAIASVQEVDRHAARSPHSHVVRIAHEAVRVHARV